ncbi:MAG TPA: GntR family transcriptional regulator [Syntrophorhabdaceae bacterium]|nr:GntR family transcriptional regulator [Syntrophorhabdaceae bacterium]
MSNLLPIYYQIKQTIKDWIISGEFQPGERIPSENVLAERFKVSRPTLRQAISQLVQEGLLQSKRGYGNIVSPAGDSKNSLTLESIGYVAEIFRQVQRSTTKSLKITRILPPRIVKESLGMNSSDEEVVRIERVRFLADSPSSHVVNYLPLEIGNRITEESLFTKPLVQVLGDDLGIPFKETFQTITATFANHEVAQELRIPSGSPMLQIERIMYTLRRKPILFSQILYRGDMFKYIVRFKNVRQRNGKPGGGEISTVA